MPQPPTLSLPSSNASRPLKRRASAAIGEAQSSTPPGAVVAISAAAAATPAALTSLSTLSPPEDDWVPDLPDRPLATVPPDVAAIATGEIRFRITWNA